MEKYNCHFCGKECKNKMSKVKHEHFCKLNPNHENIMKHHYSTTLEASRSRKSREKALITRWKNIQMNEKEHYEEYTFICKKCGKVFTRRLKSKHFLNNYKVPEYCSHACANSHIVSDVTKQKISETLKKKLEIERVCSKCGTKFISTSKKPNILCNECHHISKFDNKNKKYENKRFYKIKKIDYHKSFCIYCNKPILKNVIMDIACPNCAVEHNEHVFRVYDVDTQKIIIPDIVRKRLSEAMKLRVMNGTHKGWKTRPIASFPEKFWMKVLKNNGIEYEFNKPISKSSLGLKHESVSYFLDFCIDGYIDLEIDGKQHKYDNRKNSDIIRDNLLKENGFLVYRIDWNEINTDNGKKCMEEKINAFIKWLNDLRRLQQK